MSIVHFQFDHVENKKWLSAPGTHTRFTIRVVPFNECNKCCEFVAVKLVSANIVSISLLQSQIRKPRSIELTAAQKLVADTRLSNEMEPLSYILELHPNVSSASFIGTIKINVTWKSDAKVIELHAHSELNVNETDVRVRLLGTNES